MDFPGLDFTVNLVDKRVSAQGLIGFIRIDEVFVLILPDAVLFVMLVVGMQHLTPQKAFLPFADVVQPKHTVPDRLHEQAEAGGNIGDAHGSPRKQEQFIHVFTTFVPYLLSEYQSTLSHFTPRAGFFGGEIMKKKTPAIPRHIIVDTSTGEVVGSIRKKNKKLSSVLLLILACVVSFSIGVFAHLFMDSGKPDRYRTEAEEKQSVSLQRKNPALEVYEGELPERDVSGSIEERLQRMRES